MDGFKDSTKMKYMGGGMVGGYAKGGMAKGEAKIGKVMGEFKKGELHSGSKEGPKVKNPKQAVAIAMSEARKAGMKAPMKKGGGGDVKMPSPAESAASGNRMSAQEGAERREMMKRDMKKRVPATRREPMLPPVGASVASGNRMSAQEGAEMKKMAVGGKAPAPNMMSVAPSPGKGSPKMSGKAADMYKQIQARVAQARAEAQAAAMKRAPERPLQAPPNASGNKFIKTMPMPAKGYPQTGGKAPAPNMMNMAGVAPVDPSKAAMMKKGGLATMPKGKC